jgi:hypothetical protein
MAILVKGEKEKPVRRRNQQRATSAADKLPEGAFRCEPS